MKPIKLEILLEGKGVKKGFEEVGGASKKMEQDFRKALTAQYDLIKKLEKELATLEKQLNKTSPGAAKAKLGEQVQAAKKVIQEEKKALDELEGSVNKNASSSQTLRTQIRNLENDMATMTEATKEYSAALQKLGDLKDRQADISKQGQIFSDDNKNIRATADAIAGLSGAMSAGVGAASLFGVEGEKLAQIQTRLQAVMAMTIGIQQVANTLNKDSYFSHIVLGGAKRKMAAAQAFLNTQLGIGVGLSKALMVSGIGLLIAGIGLAITAYKNWNREQKEFNKLQLEVSKSIQGELVEVKSLENVLKNSNNSYEARKKALDKLKEIMPTYNASLSTEGALIKDNTGALELYIKQLKNSARAKIATDKLIAAENKYNEWISNLSDFDIEVLFTYPTTLDPSMKFAYGVLSAQQDELKGEVDKLTGELGKYTAEAFENSQEKEAPKTAKLINLLGEQYLSALRKIEQQRIDLMEDGYKKRKQQAELDYQLTLDAVEKDRQARLKHIEELKNSGETIDAPKERRKAKAQASTQSDNAKQLLDTNIKKIDAEEEDNRKEEVRKEAEKFEQLRAKYQDYTEQRLAIEKKFNDDIEALKKQRNSENAEQVDRAVAQATANKGRELMTHDLDVMKKSPEYVRAFEDLKNTSSETLSSLLAQFEETKQAAAEVLSPDQLREYTTTIQEIMDELDERNPFQALLERKQEMAEAERELAEAKKNLDAVKSGKKIVTGVKKDEKTGNLEISYLKGEKALEAYNNAKDKSLKKNNAFLKAQRATAAQIDELANSIKAVGSAIGGTGGDVLNLIGDIASFAMGAMDGLTVASNTASTAVATVEKASVILAVIGAAIQIAMKLADLFGGDDGVKEYERAKDVYEGYIGLLDKVIEKQKELFNLNNETGRQAVKNAQDAIKQQEKVARTLGKQYLNSGAKWNSSSKGVLQWEKMSIEAVKEAREALGRDFYAKGVGGGRMTGLFDLSIEQLKKLRDDSLLFWSELDTETKNYLNQIIASEEKLKEIAEGEKVGLTGVSGDEFYNSYVDKLKEMDSSSKDFANNFEEYLQNAILSSMMADKYSEKIKAFRKRWAEKTASGNELTRAELEQLRAEERQLTEEILKERKELKEKYGWKDQEDERQAAAKGVQSVTQDTANKIEGQLAYIQMQSEKKAVAINNMSAALHNALAPLSRIAANTEYCKHLEKMQKDMESMSSNISSMQSQGLNLKR